MYDTAELADAQADYEASFLTSQTANVLRNERNTDYAGGWIITTDTVLTDVPCRLTTPQREHKHEEGEGLVASLRFRAELPIGTDVRQADSLLVDGVTYRVIDTDAGRPEALCLTVQLVGVGA